MAIHVELEPHSLRSQHSSLDMNLSTAIGKEFNDGLTQSLAGCVIQPEFDTDQTIMRLHEAIDDVAPSVFSRRYHFEQNYKYEGRPVHVLLGDLALSEDAVVELVPEQQFLDDIHLQVDDSREGIEALKYLHDLWPAKTFEYLSAIEAAVGSDDPATGDQLLEIVTRMAEDSEALTLDPEHSEGLLLIAHLPWETRQLTRRLLVGNHLIAKLDLALGRDKTPEEDKLLSALHTHFIADNLHGQHWEFKKFELSEASQVEIARFSAENISTLGMIQQEAGKDSGQRFIATWDSVTEDLSQLVESADLSSPVVHWQSIDIGHAFKGFRGVDLYKAFRLGHYSKNSLMSMSAEFCPEKSGLKAVILEDDPAQLKQWRETIQSHTSFTSEDELAFTSPRGIDAVIDDPEIGLFLLDIQNGSDLTAGVRIGEQILRQRLELNKTSTEPIKTKIIVWSASGQAVNEATEYFKQLVERLDHQVNYQLGGSGRSGSSPIMIEVRRKTWHAYSDIE